MTKLFGFVKALIEFILDYLLINTNFFNENKHENSVSTEAAIQVKPPKQFECRQILSAWFSGAFSR